MTFEQLKRKAMDGDRQAQCVLGKRYEKGFEIPKNKRQALRCYRKAAERGFAPAQMRLASMYRSMYLDHVKESMDEAIRWYREAANQGVVAAQRELGNALKEENPQDQDAAYWFSLVAEGGDAEAQFMLAKCLELGDGVPKNYAEAFRWYSAAEQNQWRAAANPYPWLGTQANYKVGRCFTTGQGVQKNADEALKRLAPIADPRITKSPSTMPYAQHLLCVLFADPEHGKVDLVEAYAWLSLVAAYGPSGQSRYGEVSRESAVELLDIIEARLTGEQLHQAQKRSAELFVPRQKIYERLGIEWP